MSRTLIVGAAARTDARVYYRRLIGSHDGPIVAADGGGMVCLEAGRTPDVLVGDFDSLRPDVRTSLEAAGTVVKPAPADKDVTDLDLAIAAARQLGATHIVVTAAWTDRLDHTLAAIGTLLSCSGLVADIEDSDVAGWVLDGERCEDLILDGSGATFSLFALQGGNIVSCEGARYPLHRAELLPLSSRGLSNRVTARSARVHVSSGRLLVLTHTVAGVPPAVGTRVSR